MHSNVQHFPDPLEPSTKPLVFHVVRGKPHVSRFDNPWLEMIPSCSPWCVACAAVTARAPGLLCARQEVTPGISSILFPGTLFPTLSPPRFARGCCSDQCHLWVGDTGASPVICTCDLPCPEKSFPSEEHGLRWTVPAGWRQHVSYRLSTCVEQLLQSHSSASAVYLRKGTLPMELVRVWCLIFN